MKTVLFILASALTSFAALLPTNQTTDWTPGTAVGVPGGIPTNRTTLINVTLPPYNANNTGTSDAGPAIQSAINAAPAGQVVYLPAGTYRINATLFGKDNITIRGAGIGSSIILPFGGSEGIHDRQGTFEFYLDPTTLGSTAPVVTAGATRGSTTITVSDTSAFTVGKIIQIKRFASTNQFEIPLVFSAGGNSTGNGSWTLRQLVKLASKTPTTLTFAPALMNDMNAEPCRVVAGVSSSGGFGVEDLTIDLTNTTGQKGIFLEGQFGSWVLRVKIRQANNYSIHLMDSLRCEIRDCYLDALNHSGNNGAALLFDTVGSSLAQNNIMIDSFPSWEENAGCTGNVFAYNFCKNGNGYFAIDFNHGAHNSYTLIEGNICTALVADGFYGSVAWTTIFRNWCTGIDTSFPSTAIGYALSLKRWTRNTAMIGNVIGVNFYTMAYDGTSFGQPNIGNGTDNGGLAPPWPEFPNAGSYQEFDTGVAATLTRKGNYDYFTHATESLGGDPLPDSLYLSAKPTWFGNLAWPPIVASAPGTPSENTIYQKIPAGYRYINGVDPPPGGPDVTPPTVSGTPSIDTTGQILSVQFSEPVQNGSGGSSGWTIAASGGPATVAFTSGTGSSQYLLTISRPIVQGETVTIGYTQPGNGVVDLAAPPNALVTFTGRATTNGSTQGSISTPVITLAAGPYFGAQSTTITEATPGAAIHYTTNGSTPTIASPTYSTAIPISSNITIKAIATKSGLPDSPVATSVYEVGPWTVTPAGTKTFAIPAVTTSLPWTFTVTPAAAPSNTTVSLGPAPISGPPNWSIAITLNASGVIQARNGATFTATQVVNYTTAPVTIRVDINYAAKTFSATANNVVFATNYGFADGQPAPVSINYVGLFSGVQNATISNMTFQTGTSSGRYIGLRNVTNSP